MYFNKVRLFLAGQEAEPEDVEMEDAEMEAHMTFVRGLFKYQ